MALAYVAVGSNLGNKSKNLSEAEKLLRETRNVSFRRASKVYETIPVGGPSEQENYLNAVWEIETALLPAALLKELLSIEKRLGRVRNEKNGPRTLDLDILFYGEKVLSKSGLTIPHPRLESRDFVLKPLMDLCPELKHPILKKTVRELYKQVISNS